MASLPPRLRRRLSSGNCVTMKESVSRQEFPLSKCVSFLHLCFSTQTFVVSVCLFSLLAAAVKVGWPSPLSQQPQLHGSGRAEVHGLGIGLSDPWEDERARPSFLPCLVCFLSPFLSVLNCHEFLQLNSGQGIKHLVRLKVHG